MSLEPIATQSRTDAVISSLTRYISDVNLSVGERLPSERELASALEVSRPILREALKHLAALGIIETKTGSGTYLRRPASPNNQHIVMQLESERNSLVQLLQLRRALEGEAAALSAENASASDIDELENLVDTLELVHQKNGTAPEEDKAFHLALYKYSGNPLFAQVILPFWEMMEELNVRPSQIIDQKTLGHHRQTLEAIRSRDADAARQTIFELLSLVEEDLKKTSQAMSHDIETEVITSH